MEKETLKKIIIETITGNTEYWQSFGKKEGCGIVEEAEPFFWRVNSRWAEEVADKILKILSDKTNKGRQSNKIKF